MLLIPLGRQDSEVRRWPVVTFAIIGICVVVFLLSNGGRAPRNVALTVEQALDYIEAHPYLSVPPELATEMGPGFDAALEDLRADWRAGARLDADAVGREQATLNDLATQAVAALRSRPASRLGFTPARPTVAGLLTHMFAHAGFWHLFGNLFILYLCAPFVEDTYGRALFAALYLASGLAGAGAEAARHPGSSVPLVGASGAIAGVMGAFLVRLGHARIRFLFLPIPILPNIRTHLLLPAFVVLPLWAFQQFLGAHEQGSNAGDVAFAAHVGGFLFGVAAALAIRLSRLEERWIAPAIEGRIGIAQHAGIEAALEARLGGDLRSARRHIRDALASDPSNVDAWRESYEIALAEGNAAEVGRSGGRVLAGLVRNGEIDLAAEIASDRRWEPLAPMPPRFVVDAASVCERAGDLRAALSLYERVEREAPSDIASLRALLRRADILAAGGNVAGARAALERARAHPACTDSWPSVVEKASARLRG